MVDNESLNDIINQIQNKSKSVEGKSFEERISVYEEINNPNNNYQELMTNQVNEIFKGGSETGVYHAAYKALDEKVKDPNGIVEKDDIEHMLETYVDAFLEKVHPEYQNIISEAKKDGASDDEIRDIKSNFFGIYIKDEHGQRVDPFNKDLIKKLAGKKKSEVKLTLGEMSENHSSSYLNHIYGKAVGSLIKEDDISNLHEHTKGKFEDAGYNPDTHNLTKSTSTLSQDYSTLLKGGDMAKRGYKKINFNPSE